LGFFFREPETLYRQKKREKNDGSVHQKEPPKKARKSSCKQKKTSQRKRGRTVKKADRSSSLLWAKTIPSITR